MEQNERTALAKLQEIKKYIDTQFALYKDPKNEWILAELSKLLDGYIYEENTIAAHTVVSTDVEQLEKYLKYEIYKIVRYTKIHKDYDEMLNPIMALIQPFIQYPQSQSVQPTDSDEVLKNSLSVLDKAFKKLGKDGVDKIIAEVKALDIKGQTIEEYFMASANLPVVGWTDDNMFDSYIAGHCETLPISLHKEWLQQYKLTHSPIADTRIEDMREWMNNIEDIANKYDFIAKFNKLFPKQNS